MPYKYVKSFEEVNDDQRHSIWKKLNGLKETDDGNSYEASGEAKVTRAMLIDPSSPHYDPIYKAAHEKYESLKTKGFDFQSQASFKYVSTAETASLPSQGETKIMGGNVIDFKDLPNSFPDGFAGDGIQMPEPGAMNLIGGGTLLPENAGGKELMISGDGIDYSDLDPSDKGGKGDEPTTGEGDDGDIKTLSAPSILILEPESCESGLICGGRCVHVVEGATRAQIDCMCSGKCEQDDCKPPSFSDGSGGCCKNPFWCESSQTVLCEGETCTGLKPKDKKKPRPKELPKTIEEPRDWGQNITFVQAEDEDFVPFCTPVYLEEEKPEKYMTKEEYNQSQALADGTVTDSFDVKFTDKILGQQWAHKCLFAGTELKEEMIYYSDSTIDSSDTTIECFVTQDLKDLNRHVWAIHVWTTAESDGYQPTSREAFIEADKQDDNTLVQWIIHSTSFVPREALIPHQASWETVVITPKVCSD